MNTPRILFLDHAGVLGGAELYLLDVARPYRDTSRVILFEAGPFQQRLRENDIPVDICPAPPELLNVETSGNWWAALRAIPGLAQLTCRIAQGARGYDVLFANSQKSLFVAGLAGLLAHRPVVWNLHDMLTADHFSALNRTAAVSCANLFVDHIIANSEATKNAFGASGGRTDKTTVVYNGIDAEPFYQVDDTALPELRDEFAPADAPLVGVFSRLAPWKGQHVVLNMLPNLPDVHVLFVGDTLFRGDEPYERELKRTAQKLNVANRVHFLGFRRDIPRLMRLIDIVLHTSTAPEPFGRVIVEGMLAGTPVIATRAGGATEIVREPDTGILVPAGDADALAAAVQDLLSDPDRAHSMGKNARSYARHRFSIERMQTNVGTVINNVRMGTR